MIGNPAPVFLAFIEKNITIAVVILAVLAVRFLLRRYPKKYSYLLWSIVGIRMMFDLPFTSRFSIFNLFRPLLDHTSQADYRSVTSGATDLNARILSASGISRAADLNSGILSASGISRAADLNSGILSASEVSRAADTAITAPLSQASASALHAAGNAAASVPGAVAHTPSTLISVLCGIWLAGMLVFLLYGIYSYARCRHLVRTAVILNDIQPPVFHTHGFLRCCKPARVWECDQIPSPFVLGIFHARIYIPFRMSEQEQTYILAHEQYHIRRRDPLIKLLAFLLLAVYWCNPLAWVAFFYMVRDMEMSCDESVIASLGNGIKKDYSTSLLSFAMTRHPYSFAPVAFGEGDACRRIKNVLGFKKPKPGVTAVMLLIVALVGVCCLTNRTESNAATLDAASASGQTGLLANAAEATPSALQDIRLWAQYFCDRDSYMIRKMTTPSAQSDLHAQNLMTPDGTIGNNDFWPALVFASSYEDQYRIVAFDPDAQTAEILYFAQSGHYHSIMWKEAISYTYDHNSFMVTHESMKMYDSIETASDFDAAYPFCIKGSGMDYTHNAFGIPLKSSAKQKAQPENALFDASSATRQLLNLSEDTSKVSVELLDEKLTKSGLDSEALVQITFHEDGSQRNILLTQPWIDTAIWIPQYVVTASEL